MELRRPIYAGGTYTGIDVSALLQRVMRSLPPFRGKLRLARFLVGDLSGSAMVIDRLGFVYEVPDLRESLAFQLAINGSYEPHVQDLIQRKLHPGAVFIDVGANIGTFTVPAASRVGPGGCVVAIEAAPSIFSILQANIARNACANVHLVCAAAGDMQGNTHFYPAPIHKFGMGSRAPEFDVEPITVPSVTLDALAAEFGLQSVDVIKIDVEGFELDVLKGAVGLLDRNPPPLIVFEFIDWAEARIGPRSVGAAQRFLMNHGFSIRRVSDYERAKSIEQPITSGADMLVAER